MPCAVLFFAAQRTVMQGVVVTGNTVQTPSAGQKTMTKDKDDQ